MRRVRYLLTLGAIALTMLAPLQAAGSERDFSGKWILDPAASNDRALPDQPDQVLTVEQQAATLRCSAIAGNGASVKWVYALNGSESKYRLGDAALNSVAKWEGAALLINSLVSGPRDYTQMDRWKLSADRSALTITRQVVRGQSLSEGTLVYRREGSAVPVPVAALAPLAEPAVLARRPDAASHDSASQAEVTVPAGTRVLLVLRNTVDTKHSHEGDRIYLETEFPIGIGGRIVIPRGSFVTGTVTQTKQPGHGSGKGELFIRFDTLMLANGVTREFRSRLGSAGGAGTVDRKEGKITGESDKAGNARTVATTTGAGGGVGVIAGSAAGHMGMGAGIGAAAGAAAGLAHVLSKRGADASLPRGTSVEMILDRDLQFSSADLRF
jgi:hypothetical protein